MTHLLTEEERAYYTDLEAHFTHYVAQYEAQKQGELSLGHRPKLEAERARLRRYMDLVTAASASDVLTNIKFAAAKLNVLNTMLGDEQAEQHTEPVSLTRTQLRALGRSCSDLFNPATHAVLDSIGFAHRLLNTLHDGSGKRISSITIHLAITGDEVEAYFNDHNARLASATVERCVLTLDPRGSVILKSRQPLSDAQRHRALVSLSRHLFNYS